MPARVHFCLSQEVFLGTLRAARTTILHGNLLILIDRPLYPVSPFSFSFWSQSYIRDDFAVVLNVWCLNCCWSWSYMNLKIRREDQWGFFYLHVSSYVYHLHLYLLQLRFSSKTHKSSFHRFLVCWIGLRKPPACNFDANVSEVLWDPQLWMSVMTALITPSAFLTVQICDFFLLQWNILHFNSLYTLYLISLFSAPLASSSMIITLSPVCFF